MARKDVHVTPDGRGRWQVTDGDTEKGFETQAEAERIGRDRAKETGAEFFLHGEDGRIRERDSYGNDPRDIPG
jgi:hypothetical protein